MNREIKFRAWDPAEKRMIYNRDPMPERYGIYSWNELGYQATLTWLLGDSNNFKWMQYTGLKDRNGKEIYEGDILKFHLFEGANPRRWVVEIPRFYLAMRGADETQIEIIGNIYESPELIDNLK